MGRMANCRAGGLRKFLQRAGSRAMVVMTMRTGKPLPWLFRRSLHQVEHVVANSMDARDVLLRTYGVAAEKIAVIRNALVFMPEEGVSEVDRMAKRAQIRTAHGVSIETMVMLWVGMFRPEKNQKAMIEIAAKLKAEGDGRKPDERGRSVAQDWQLWFAGEGPEKTACEALVRERGLSDRVKFLGFADDPRPLYVAADVAVLTSKSESLSNFLIEAHAHGRPSVAYETTGVPECGGRVVKMDDEAAFVEVLKALLANEALRKKDSERVATHAKEHFSPEVQAKKYLELFANLLNDQ
jgi:glycosyltransferase involved in cell wall biosynthesis